MLVVTLSSYQGFRYPVEVIAHAVWLYFRFPLSFREVEEILLERDITVSYETVRQWTGSSGRRTPTGCAGAVPAPGTSGSTFFLGRPQPFVGLWGPGELGVADKWLSSRGFRCLAARLPTPTRPPIGKCEQVAV
ncbi:hypothetical protein ABIE67_009425 [Streptomyces sp. V4I8]